MKVALSAAAKVVTATVTFDPAMGELPQPWKVDWGDGSAVATVASGTSTANHTYVADSTYKVTVHANDNESTQAITVGVAPFKAYDPLKIAENSVVISRANEKAKAAQIMGIRSHVG